MNGEQKVQALVIMAIFFVAAGIVVGLCLDAYREDELAKEAMEKGYVQKLENGVKLWVKP